MPRSRVRPASFLLLVGVASMTLVASGAQPVARRFGQIDDARLLQAAREPQNWLVDGGSYLGTHYSPLRQITVDNVAALRPAWFFELDSTRGQESEPVVVDGVMYLSTAWSRVYALDAATGRELWRYDPQVPGPVAARGCCDVVNRGVAVYKGRVYLAALDGRLIALDARSGRVRWSTQTVDPRQMYTITGAPRVFRDKVVIGNAGAEFGVRGYVSAYDAGTGRMLWRFYTAPGDPAHPADGAVSDEVMQRLSIRPVPAL